MAAEVILRVKVDRSEYKKFKDEIEAGLTAGSKGKTKKDIDDIGKAAESSTSKLQSLGEMLSKKIAWYSISMAITSVTTAFKDALNEIKEVDTQLTNIAKVSNASAQELENLSKKAYSTASKYGVEASQYMEAVYEYTKAGFQDNADVMAELSTKAMLVGDTTAAVADKFLIAGNAAWNYGKNVEALSLLVDKADYINNNYATTFDKIAEGFPRVASVASMAGMSAEETMAALGTITATTQETASRASTALRALIINILGDTTTEIEDGVTATVESVQSLQDALRKYAPDVIAAAEATGTLIDPMESLKALSEAYKRGDLTQADLFGIESALGGKLRTNQLDALLKNFGLYEEMLGGMATAAGTADKEIETMLGSWESKSRILKNTWTEFVSKSLSADTFKGIIDWLTKLLDRFGSLNELMPTVVTGLTALFAPYVVASIKKVVDGFKNIRSAISGLKDADVASAISTGISMGAAAIGIAYTAYKNYINKIRQDADEAVSEAYNDAKTAESEFDTISELYKEYQKAKAAEDGSAESKKALQTASENLAAALGIEKDAVEGLADSLDELTKKQLEQKVAEIGIAVDSAERALITESATYDKAFAGTTNPIIQKSQKTYTVNAYEGTGGYYNVEMVRSEEERLKGAVEEYKKYQKQLEGYEALYSAKTPLERSNAFKLGGGQSSYGLSALEFSRLSKEGIATETAKIQSWLNEADTIGKYIELLDAQKEYNRALRDLEYGVGSVEEVTEAEEKLAEAEENAAEAAGEMAKAQKKVSDAFDTIRGNASSATDAIEKYQNALKGTSGTEDNADALVNAAQKAIEAIESGLKDSSAVMAFADLWFSPEKFAEIREAGLSTADALYSDEMFRRIFIQGTDENGETVFNDAIEASKQLAEVVKEFDTDGNNLLTDATGKEIWARLYETEEGTKIIVEDWDALAKQFGVTTDSLKIMLDMYGLLIPGMEASTSDLIAFADAANAFYETADGIKRIDLGKVIEAAFAQGATQGEVDNLVDSLKQAQENGDIELVMDDDQVRTADKSTRTLIDSLDDVEVKRIIRINQDDVEDAQTKLDKLRKITEGLQDTNLTIKVNTIYGVPTLPDILQKGAGLASGTDYAKGGATLVNEEGAEIIQANGRAWIAGNGKPVIANIPRGAKVWTAKETQAILGNSDLSALYGGINAMAGGSKVPDVLKKLPRTTKAENAHFFADTSDDELLKNLKEVTSLRKSELELIENSGESLSKQIKKQKGIQESLVRQINRLREIGGSQEEINQLAAEWYSINDSISSLEEERANRQEEREKKREERQQEHLDGLEKSTSLLESELKLIDASGGSVKSQILKQREISQSLQKRINYLKKIGGHEEEINELLTEQYNIKSKITGLEAGLYSDLQTAVEKRITEITEKRDKELALITEKINKIKEQHDLEKEENELAEKRLAVEKAYEALTKAKSQRTVRVFNPATGRWEWTYNASAVQSAREAWQSARKDLKDYNSEQRYEARIAKLESRQSTINERYQAQIDKWQKVLDAMEEPVRSIQSSLNQISKNATKEMLPTIKKINRALRKLGRKGINTDNLYDSGGILHGIGGIKGTSADEIILPPDVTRRMLNPSHSSTFGQRLNELRYLYGATGNLAGVANNAIGSQHNGDVYTFGNITLTRDQAKATSVYELARMSRGLRSYSSAM